MFFHLLLLFFFVFFFSSRRRHTRWPRDWSSDVCSSDLLIGHSHHPDVVGTLGQLPPGAVTLIETAHDAATFAPKDPNNLAFVTQTTLTSEERRVGKECRAERWRDQ